MHNRYQSSPMGIENTLDSILLKTSLPGGAHLFARHRLRSTSNSILYSSIIIRPALPYAVHPASRSDVG